MKQMNKKKKTWMKYKKIQSLFYSQTGAFKERLKGEANQNHSSQSGSEFTLKSIFYSTTAVTCIKDQSSWSRGCTRAAFTYQSAHIHTCSQRLRCEGDLYHSFYPFRKGLQAAIPIYQTASHLKSNFPQRHHEITDIFSPSPPPCQSP